MSWQWDIRGRIIFLFQVQLLTPQWQDPVVTNIHQVNHPESSQNPKLPYTTFREMMLWQGQALGKTAGLTFFLILLEIQNGATTAHPEGSK